MITVTKEFNFSAAHNLPNHKGLCRRLHGHNYKLFVEVKRIGGSKDCVNVDENSPACGMVIDFGNLKIALSKIIEGYDHRLLNDFFPNPTAENMLLTISSEITIALKNYSCELVSLKLYETDTSFATWYNPNMKWR